MTIRQANPVEEPLLRSALTCASLDIASTIRLIDHGASGDLIAQVSGERDVIVKVAHPNNVAELRREVDALQWLCDKARVPKIVRSGVCGSNSVLITEVLPGVPVSHVEARLAPKALEAVIEALAALHTLDYAKCPFDNSLNVRFREAERRTREGLVDIADFDPIHRGWSASRLFAHAQKLKPRTETLAVTHGDASLPNFIWSADEGVGIIDLGRFGVADPYQDFAIFLRSAKRNHFHIDAAALLCKYYPLNRLDDDKCVFYRLLDEFF